MTTVTVYQNGVAVRYLETGSNVNVSVRADGITYISIGGNTYEYVATVTAETYKLVGLFGDGTAEIVGLTVRN